MTNKEILSKFRLLNGQFFAFYAYKNLQWFLDGCYIGFGDLRDEDILFIQTQLEDGQEFVGWNEHHGTQWQQTKTPMVRITNKQFTMREDIINKEGK